MKRWLLAAVLLVGFSSISAKLTWVEEKIDFGTIRETDGKVTRNFSCRNDGSEPVMISRVRTTCGCTSVATKGETVLPGESVQLPVTYNPVGRPGHFDKGVMVYTADSTYRLGVTGNVIPSEQTLNLRYPESVGGFRMTRSKVMMGDVELGNLRSRSIAGFNVTDDSVIVRYKGHYKDISVGVYPDMVAPAGMVSISVVYKPTDEKEIGRHDFDLPFEFGDSTVVIPMVANVVRSSLKAVDFKKAPQIRLSTKRLMAKGLDKLKVAEMAVGVKNVGKSDLQIRRVVASDSIIAVKAKFPVSLKPGMEMKIPLAVQGKLMKDSLLNERVIISTNDPADPEATVRVVGTK